MIRILSMLLCSVCILALASCGGSHVADLQERAAPVAHDAVRGASAVVGRGGPGGCMPTVGATFDCASVTTTSSKDLSNVVLLFCDGKHQKFDGLSGNSRTFSGTGGNAGKVIKGVWIKSGCNLSGAGPGYGEFVGAPGNPCETCNDCPPPPCTRCGKPCKDTCKPVEPPCTRCGKPCKDTCTPSPPPPPCVKCSKNPCGCPAAPAPCSTCGGKNKNDGKDACCDGNAGKGNDWKCGQCGDSKCRDKDKKVKRCKPAKDSKSSTCNKCGSKNKNDGKDACCDGNAGKGNDWKCGQCGDSKCRDKDKKVKSCRPTKRK